MMTMMGSIAMMMMTHACAYESMMIMMMCHYGGDDDDDAHVRACPSILCGWDLRCWVTCKILPQ